MDDQVEEYHFHVYFFQHNPTSRDLAFQLRRDFSLFVEERLIVAAFDKVHDGPAGPHPTGSFEIWVPAEYFEPALSWFLIHRPISISILCHPLTRHELLDHTARAIWLGTPLGLDLSVLSPELDRAPSRYNTLRLGYSKNNSDPLVAEPIQPVLMNNNQNEQPEKEFDELRDSMCSVCSDDEIDSQNHVPTIDQSNNTHHKESTDKVIEDNATSLARVTEAVDRHHEHSSAITSVPPNTSTDVTTDKVTHNNNILHIPNKPELIVADPKVVPTDRGKRKKKKKSKEKKQKKTKKSSSTLATLGSRSAMPIPVINPYLVSTQQVKTALQTLTAFPSSALTNTHIERPVHREPPPVPVSIVPAFTSLFGYNSTLLNPSSQVIVPQVIQQQSSLIRRNDISMLIDTPQHLTASMAQEFPAAVPSTEQTVDVPTMIFQPAETDAPVSIPNNLNIYAREELNSTQATSDLLPHTAHPSDEHAAQHLPFPTEKQALLPISSAPGNNNNTYDALNMPQLSTTSNGARFTDVIAMTTPAILLEPRADASIVMNNSALVTQTHAAVSAPVATIARLIDAPATDDGPDHIQSADLQPNVITSVGSGTAAPFHTGHKRSRSPSPSHNRKRQRLSPSFENNISCDSGSESDSDCSSSSSSVRIIGVNQVYRSTIDVEEIDARPVSDLQSEVKPKFE